VGGGEPEEGQRVWQKQSGGAGRGTTTRQRDTGRGSGLRRAETGRDGGGTE